MEFVRNLRRNAAALGKTIVLPEAWDERMLRAAAIIHDEGIARVILLGDPEPVPLAALGEPLQQHPPLGLGAQRLEALLDLQGHVHRIPRRQRRALAM